MVRVLITGMSGTGKSAVVGELRRRGYLAFDADDDGYAEPSGNGGEWRWRVEAVAELLATAEGELLFFAGCAEDQAAFDWDRKILLTAPEPLILSRVRERSSNAFGKSADERSQILQDLREVEPLLRRTADVVVDTRQPLTVVTDSVLSAAIGDRGGHP